MSLARAGLLLGVAGMVVGAIAPARARADAKAGGVFRWPWSRVVKVDSRLIEAARIAESRAGPEMTWYCWRYVKDALLAAGVVDKRPKSRFAVRAGRELADEFGFERIQVSSPYDAPVGAVLVYRGADGGHIEFRTEDGFASDFFSATPYPRELEGVYIKPARG